MAVEALGSSVLVVINMLVMSAYSDSVSMEVPIESVDEEEEEDGLDSEESEDVFWIV